MEKLVATHTCEAESGERFKVREYQTFIDASSHDGRGQIEGGKRFTLAAGSPVNVLADGTFQVVITGQILRKIG